MRGTGKTLLSLWIAEALECGDSSPLSRLATCRQTAARQAAPRESADKSAHSKILVLLPSLALVRQTLHEWLHGTRLPSLAYLCVCSGGTVASDLDPIATPQSELGFEVTIDSRTVREFLDAPFAGVKVILSTYQSARVVAAGMECGDVSPRAESGRTRALAGRRRAQFSQWTAIRLNALPCSARARNTAREGARGPHLNGIVTPLTSASSTRRTRPPDARAATSPSRSTQPFFNFHERTIHEVLTSDGPEGIRTHLSAAAAGVNKVFTFGEGEAIGLRAVNVRRVHREDELRVGFLVLAEAFPDVSKCAGCLLARFAGRLPL